MKLVYYIKGVCKPNGNFHETAGAVSLLTAEDSFLAVSGTFGSVTLPVVPHH